MRNWPKGPLPSGVVPRASQIITAAGDLVLNRWSGSVAWIEGWLDTGDLGHFDEDGYLFLAGRSDDVINRGGEKIYPREIEDVLLAQPGVGSAAVVGVRDEVLGERPVAYVVPAGSWPGGPFEEAELAQALREACEEALPRAKRPSVFCLVPELPAGPTGKVARRRLRELAMAGRSAGRADRGDLVPQLRGGLASVAAYVVPANRIFVWTWDRMSW